MAEEVRTRRVPTINHRDHPALEMAEESDTPPSPGVVDHALRLLAKLLVAASAQPSKNRAVAPPKSTQKHVDVGRDPKVVSKAS